jgi:hypothetical protein
MGSMSKKITRGMRTSACHGNGEYASPTGTIHVGPFRQLAILALKSLRPCSFASSPFGDFAFVDWRYYFTIFRSRIY